MARKTAMQQVVEMLKEVYDEGNVNTALIFKGYAHDTMKSGWHMRWFGRSNHIFMGRSVAEVRDYCDNAREARY